MVRTVKSAPSQATLITNYPKTITILQKYVNLFTSLHFELSPVQKYYQGLSLQETQPLNYKETLTSLTPLLKILNTFKKEELHLFIQRHLGEARELKTLIPETKKTFFSSLIELFSPSQTKEQPPFPLPSHPSPQEIVAKLQEQQNIISSLLEQIKKLHLSYSIRATSGRIGSSSPFTEQDATSFLSDLERFDINAIKKIITLTLKEAEFLRSRQTRSENKL